jgi:hypothetical protein
MIARWAGAATQRIVGELIDDIVDAGRADLIDAFAADILGLDAATPKDIHFWSRSIMNGSTNYDDDTGVWGTARRATDEIDTAVEAALGGSGPRAGSIIPLCGYFIGRVLWDRKHLGGPVGLTRWVRVR